MLSIVTATEASASMEVSGTNVTITLPPSRNAPPVATRKTPGLFGGNKLKLPKGLRGPFRCTSSTANETGMSLGLCTEPTSTRTNLAVRDNGSLPTARIAARCVRFSAHRSCWISRPGSSFSAVLFLSVTWFSLSCAGWSDPLARAEAGANTACHSHSVAVHNATVARLTERRRRRSSRRSFQPSSRRSCGCPCRYACRYYSHRRNEKLELFQNQVGV